ncbi:hypothetical protein [Sphingomonas pruni]|uniref:hypothetical protein n=1 Tax=Sphingomonas pruni TaxID=40683 RepID=UPI0014716859|nr:hypothetical protein [Sphingomonas pruni]
MKPYVGFAMLLALAACDKPSSPPKTPLADTADMDFVQAFVGSCVQTFPDFARIEAAARAMKWKRVTDPDMLKMIGPADGGSGWKAWTFKTGKKGFLLSTGERDVEGKALKFCVLIAEPSDIEATRNHIVKLLNAKREYSSEEGGQRYATYSFLQDDKPLILNFIDAVPMSMKMLNVSTMTPPGS